MLYGHRWRGEGVGCFYKGLGWDLCGYERTAAEIAALARRGQVLPSAAHGTLISTSVNLTCVGLSIFSSRRVVCEDEVTFLKVPQ